MTLPTLAIKIDWNNDGDFSDSGENVTADVISMAYSRGASFDGSTEAPGNCTLLVRNDDRRYSPEYASGPYYGNLKVGRACWITATYGGTTYGVFYGTLRRITPLADKTTELYLEDPLSAFDRAETNVAFSASRTLRAYRDLILDDMGLASDQRNLAYGIENDIPVTYADETNGLAALSEVNAATGSIHYIAPNITAGIHLHYKTIDRGTLLNTASSETWDDEYIVGLDGYDYTDEAVINEQRVAPVIYTLADDYAIAWTHASVPFTIPASSSVTIWASFDNPITSGVTYCTATMGTATAVTTYFGSTAKVVVTAGGTAATVSELYIDARSYSTQDAESVLVESTSSKTDYGVRRGSEIQTHMLPSRAAASGLAEWIIARYATPKPRPRITKQDHFPSLLARDIGQVITLNFARLAISARRYFIRALEGRVDAREGTWFVTYNLEEALALDTWFTLDTTGKGLDNGKLGY